MTPEETGDLGEASEPMSAEEFLQELTKVQKEIKMYDCSESHPFLRLKHWNYCNDCGEKL